MYSHGLTIKVSTESLIEPYHPSSGFILTVISYLRALILLQSVFWEYQTHLHPRLHITFPCISEPYWKPQPLQQSLQLKLKCSITLSPIWFIHGGHQGGDGYLNDKYPCNLYTFCQVCVLLESGMAATVVSAHWLFHHIPALFLFNLHPYVRTSIYLASSSP